MHALLSGIPVVSLEWATRSAEAGRWLLPNADEDGDETAQEALAEAAVFDAETVARVGRGDALEGLAVGVGAGTSARTRAVVQALAERAGAIFDGNEQENVDVLVIDGAENHANRDRKSADSKAVSSNRGKGASGKKLQTPKQKQLEHAVEDASRAVEAGHRTQCVDVDTLVAWILEGKKPVAHLTPAQSNPKGKNSAKKGTAKEQAARRSSRALTPIKGPKFEEPEKKAADTESDEDNSPKKRKGAKKVGVLASSSASRASDGGAEEIFKDADVATTEPGKKGEDEESSTSKNEIKSNMDADEEEKEEQENEGEEESEIATTPRKEVVNPSSVTKKKTTKKQGGEETPAKKTKAKVVATKKNASSNDDSEAKDFIIIAASGLQQTEHDVVMSVCDALPGAESISNSNEFADLATHIVVPTLQAPLRTVKVANGIARGAWIVKASWIYESIEKGEWVNEEEHEATESFPGCKNARLLANEGKLAEHLLSGVNIYVDAARQPPTSVLSHLLRSCGAKVVRDASKAAVIVCGSKSFRSRKSRGENNIVTEKWVFDCIQNCKFDLKALESFWDGANDEKEADSSDEEMDEADEDHDGKSDNEVQTSKKTATAAKKAQAGAVTKKKANPKVKVSSKRTTTTKRTASKANAKAKTSAKTQITSSQADKKTKVAQEKDDSSSSPVVVPKRRTPNTRRQSVTSGPSMSSDEESESDVEAATVEAVKKVKSKPRKRKISAKASNDAPASPLQAENTNEATSATKIAARTTPGRSSSSKKAKKLTPAVAVVTTATAKGKKTRAASSSIDNSAAKASKSPAQKRRLTDLDDVFKDTPPKKKRGRTPESKTATTTTTKKNTTPASARSLRSARSALYDAASSDEDILSNGSDDDYASPDI